MERKKVYNGDFCDMKKVCVVTGGGSGIGFAAAKEAAKKGYYVMIVGRNEKKLAGAVEELRKDGCEAEAYSCDVFPQPAECCAVFLHEPADAPELQISDLFDHMILFRDLDKNIRRDPAKLRMMQAAQGLQRDKPFFRNGINRLIIQFKSILRNGCVKILLHLFLV